MQLRCWEKMYRFTKMSVTQATFQDTDLYIFPKYLVTKVYKS